jgi:predicted RNA-binding Zn-ribbon protein involved in translation (DUF1610 family)
MTARRISLTVVEPPATGVILDAPPILRTDDDSVDYTCGKCDTILLHAEEHKVHGAQIHCANCGAFNSTDA